MCPRGAEFARIGPHGLRFVAQTNKLIRPHNRKWDTRGTRSTRQRGTGSTRLQQRSTGHGRGTGSTPLRLERTGRVEQPACVRARRRSCNRAACAERAAAPVRERVGGNRRSAGELQLRAVSAACGCCIARHKLHRAACNIYHNMQRATHTYNIRAPATQCLCIVWHATCYSRRVVRLICAPCSIRHAHATCNPQRAARSVQQERNKVQHAP